MIVEIVNPRRKRRSVARATVHSVFLLNLGICVTRIVPRRVCQLLCVLRASPPSCVAVVASETLTSGSWSSC